MNALRDLISEASTMADVLFEPAGQMLAHILAIARNGERTLIASPMADAEEEIMFRVKTPELLRRMGFVRWCFLTEAWMAAYPPGTSPEEMLPKECPERIEIITFAAEDAATGQRLIGSRQIYRPSPEAPGRLLPLVFAEAPARFVIAPENAAREAR